MNRDDQVFEYYGRCAVNATYLKIAVCLMAVGMLGLVGLNVLTVRQFKLWRPLVVRIDRVGNAEAVSYSDFEYHPQTVEVRYFLSEFCRLYYGRNRYTLVSDFSKSLYFLDSQLAQETEATWKKERIAEKYLADRESVDTDIDVTNVVVSSMPAGATPGQAEIDFTERLQSADGMSDESKSFRTAVAWQIVKNVPASFISVNPLGIVITSFTSFEAF